MSLGNKVMVGAVNANREYFETGVGDMAQAEEEYPGWLGQLLTDRVQLPKPGVLQNCCERWLKM